ncbi:MAG: metal-binding protein [Rubritepida sp.]|nr:metal-binding protein [Rubritepida sp.]
MGFGRSVHLSISDLAASTVTLFVCMTCRRTEDAPDAARAGARLAATLTDPPEGIHVRQVDCLAACKRGPSVAMAREGGWSYIFGGLDPAEDGAAVFEGARLLSGSPDGLMPWRGRPEALKRGMIARIPPLSLPERHA